MNFDSDTITVAGGNCSAGYRFFWVKTESNQKSGYQRR